MAIQSKQIPESNYVDTHLLRVKENALIVGNSIYPLNNISAIDSIKIKLPTMNIVASIILALLTIYFWGYRTKFFSIVTFGLRLYKVSCKW